MHDSSTATLSKVDYHQCGLSSIGLSSSGRKIWSHCNVLVYYRWTIIKWTIFNWTIIKGIIIEGTIIQWTIINRRHCCQVTSGSTVGKWFVINSCSKFLISSVGLASLHIFVFCDLWFVIRKVVTGLLFILIIGWRRSVLFFHLQTKYWTEEYQTLYPGWLKALHEDRSGKKEFYFEVQRIANLEDISTNYGKDCLEKLQ